MEIEYFQFNKRDKMGIMSSKKQTVIPAIYDFIEPFSDGLFNVTNNNLHAYFDANGKIVIPFQNKYESYGNFTEGLARVRVNDKWGYIDKTGKEIIEPQFYFAEEFSDEFAVVRNNENKHGVIDKTGQLMIDYQFNILTKFENGYAKFGDLKTYGLIDKTGKIVVPQDYIFIGEIENNKVKVQVLEGEIYKEGELTIGGSVEWNNNLDHVNEFNLKSKQFVILAEDLIQSMYKDGCPCEYQRFRNFIEWDKPNKLIDQEVLFSTFSKDLERIDDDIYRCKKCGTTYFKSWEEYSIALQVLNVKITKKGNFIEKGANINPIIPISLGLSGYDLTKLRKIYQQTDNETVMKYLKEKQDLSGINAIIQKPEPTWWQKLFSSK